MTLEEDKRFLCFWLLYYVSSFADSRMKVPRHRSSPTSRDHFFSVYSAAVKCLPNLLPFGVNCRLQLAGLGKKRERKLGSQIALCRKRLRYHSHHRQIIQCSSPVETLNLIASKSQPVELDNSTIELHVPSRRKKSLQSYCSVDFDFLFLFAI